MSDSVVGDALDDLSKVKSRMGSTRVQPIRDFYLFMRSYSHGDTAMFAVLVAKNLSTALYNQTNSLYLYISYI